MSTLKSHKNNNLRERKEKLFNFTKGCAMEMCKGNIIVRREREIKNFIWIANRDMRDIYDNYLAKRDGS